jgi:hypothetical protein
MSTCLPHAGVLTAVLAAALLGACSNSQGPAPAQSAGLHTTLPSGPSLPDLDASDPEGSRQRFHIYLHNQVDVLNTALSRIAAAGPPARTAWDAQGHAHRGHLPDRAHRWQDTGRSGHADQPAARCGAGIQLPAARRVWGCGWLAGDAHPDSLDIHSHR